MPTHTEDGCIFTEGDAFFVSLLSLTFKKILQEMYALEYCECRIAKFCYHSLLGTISEFRALLGCHDKGARNERFSVGIY